MSIKNDAEPLVRTAVAHFCKTRKATGVGCWCPMCEMDILALSLNSLPPLYCRVETYGHAATKFEHGRVRDAILTAHKRVALSPRHRPDGWPAAAPDVELINYTHDIGQTLVVPVLGRLEVGCGCVECRSDVLAYALNRCPPLYGVLRCGRRRLQPTDLQFMRHEIELLLLQAARIISSKPHHSR